MCGLQTEKGYLEVSDFRLNADPFQGAVALLCAVTTCGPNPILLERTERQFYKSVDLTVIDVGDKNGIHMHGKMLGEHCLSANLRYIPGQVVLIIPEINEAGQHSKITTEMTAKIRKHDVWREPREFAS